jgi:hypothetical protein
VFNISPLAGLAVVEKPFSETDRRTDDDDDDDNDNDNDDDNNDNNNNNNNNTLKHPSNMPGKHDIKEVQKTATLSTAHTPREVLTYKYKTFNFESNITCRINCKYRTAATLYTLEICLFEV